MTAIEQESATRIQRYFPPPREGLSSSQVAERMERGLYNREASLKTKSIGRIFRDNIFTLFNLVNILLALAILLVGSYKNLLFMGVILCNTAIGIIQEIRAKRTVDRLSILSEAKITAFRDGKPLTIGIHEIVLDDSIELATGSQIPADCILTEGSCEVNESLLTGESDAVFKRPGDLLLSGSFVVSGRCIARADRVGEENYASTIMNSAKYIKKVRSEIMETLQRIIKIVSCVIFPLGILLFLRQTFITHSSLQDAVVTTAAALIGMIPEGLVLLTSTVMAVGIIRLSKYKVLVQELYCIETLARVDVLCLDKTGTITEGSMEVEELLPLSASKEEMEEALGALTSVLTDDNPTFRAVKASFGREQTIQEASEIIPFSSEKKWSGAFFRDRGTYVMGAAEFILPDMPPQVEEKLAAVPEGRRVLLLAHSESPFREKGLPSSLAPMGLLILRDRIRKEARATLEYFEQQGVELKIISGDNVKTVSSIAQSAGLKEYDRCVDASTLKTPEELYDAAGRYTVFGRVTPSQKFDLIRALKEQGHTVAMTGDGVNDVLALKEADCSVAMASGSEAARNVSQLVLLDSNFASMPHVVAEGRRSINNIQRSASLFLVKTIYSAILAVLFLFLNAQYPFQPIQMTLMSMFTIGIPSFVLALEPNRERVQGGFLKNVLSKAVPGALTIVAGILMTMLASSLFHLSEEETSTLAVTLSATSGLMVLFKTSLPMNWLRGVLFGLMAAGFFLGATLFHSLFSLCAFHLPLFAIYVVLALLSLLIFCGLHAAWSRLQAFLARRKTGQQGKRE